jgi:hypothetical protein
LRFCADIPDKTASSPEQLVRIQIELLILQCRDCNQVGECKQSEVAIKAKGV